MGDFCFLFAGPCGINAFLRPNKQWTTWTCQTPFLSVPTDYRDQTREHQQLVDMHFLAENGKESLVTRFADIRVVGTSGDEHAPFELIADGQVVSGTPL